MRILRSYLSRSFITVFGLTLLVFIFIMAIVNIFRVLDLFSRGVSGIFILKIFSCGMPFYLIFATPMSVLAATYLIFSRLTADNEITALKACGVSVWQITEPIFMLTAILSLVCAYITCDLAPNSHFTRRVLLRALETEIPLDLLDAGRFNHELPGLNLYYVRDKTGGIRNIHVNEFTSNGVTRVIRAQRGEFSFETNASGRAVKIDLHDVSITQYDPKHPGDPKHEKRLTAAQYPMLIELSSIIKSSKLAKKRADLTMRELADALRHGHAVLNPSPDEDPAVLRTALLVEWHTRVVLALACYAFGLLGTALGIKIHRKESSIGIAITLGLVFIFYFFIIMADSLVARPELHPYLLVWVPFIVSEAAGLFIITRSA